MLGRYSRFKVTTPPRHSSNLGKESSLLIFRQLKNKENAEIKRRKGAKLRVVISPMVLSKVFYTSLVNKEVEAAGFLIGRMEEGRVLITDGIWMGSEGGRTHVELDFSVMAKVIEELEREGEVIVGWWHSHPRMGANFMSMIDIRTQQVYQAFFPYAVALIVDPIEYERNGINERSCKLYKVSEEGYEEIPFELSLELNELVSIGIRVMKRALSKEAKVILRQEAAVEERKEKVKIGELMGIAFLIWSLILLILFWLFT